MNTGPCGYPIALRTWAIASCLWLGAIADAAQTWVLTSAPITNWTSMAVSRDGTKMVAASSGGGEAWPGPIFISTNSGKSWEQTSAPMAGWNWVGSSADGTHLAAVSLGDAAADGIYISINSGVTWSQHLQINEIEGGAIACASNKNRPIDQRIGSRVY